MRRALASTFTAALLAAALPASSLADEQAPPAPFPLPLVGNKPVAVAPGQKTFRLPLGFDRVAQFYKEQFRGVAQVTLTPKRKDASPREISIQSRRATDAWAKAVVREFDSGTTVDVTPVLRADAERVEGNARPLVEFVIGRSELARKAAEDIDHTGR